jgi:hypothetical protein
MTEPDQERNQERNQKHKRDAGKARWDCLPWRAVSLVVDVLTFGAAKYGAHSWRDVDDAPNRYFAALQRHLTARYVEGEVNDPESGLPHLAQVACNALFLLSCDGPDVSVAGGPTPRRREKSDTDVDDLKPGKVASNKSLTKADLAGADLAGTNLAGADLRGAALAGANLYRANLARANLCGADLTEAYLTEANLAGANLAGANLTKADLTEAYLTEANLCEAHLEADLTKADLTKANLVGANLAGANLAGANLRGASYSQNTILPTGLNPENAGMVLDTPSASHPA